MHNILKSLVLAGCLVSASALAQQADTGAGPFAKGQKQVSVLAGSGDAFGDSYFIIGGGVNYFIADGLNVGLNLEAWTGGDPSIYKVAASMNYIFYKTPKVSPYVGAFFRYTDIENHDSLNSVGGRAGVYLKMGRNGYGGLGVVYESYLDCDTRTYVECDTTYPEVSFLFSF